MRNSGRVLRIGAAFIALSSFLGGCKTPAASALRTSEDVQQLAPTDEPSSSDQDVAIMLLSL